ncbi:hypothetical protein AB3S75_035074 [Citrus x aurantiifolia]
MLKNCILYWGDYVSERWSVGTCLLIFVEKALVEDVIPILVAAFHCQLNQLRSHCVQRVVRSEANIANLSCQCLSRERASR